MSKFRLAPFCILAVLPGLVVAQPIPSFVAGETTEGGLAIVSGTGFGANSGNRSVFDNASSSIYPDISHDSSVPAGTGFPFRSNTYGKSGALKFTHTHRRLPSLAAGFRTTGGKGHLHNPYALGGANPTPDHTQIYATFWYKPDENIVGSNHSSKFIRVWDDNGGNGTRISWTQMHLTYGRERTPSWKKWGGNTAEWNRLEFYVNSDTGVIKTWTNGRLVHDISDFAKHPGHPDKGINVERIGFDPGGANPPRFESSISEIYVSTSPARIELCDAPEWAQCSLRELQQVESWAADQVVFTVARGHFLGDTPLYIYVLDQHGRVNETGLPLCKDCPMPSEPPPSVAVD